MDQTKTQNQEASSIPSKESLNKPLEDAQTKAHQELTNESTTSTTQTTSSAQNKTTKASFDQPSDEKTEPLFATVDGEKVEETILDVDSDDRTQKVVDAIEEAIDEQKIAVLEEQLEEIDEAIRSLMKKYKLTMWTLVGCIVIYLLFLFVFRPAWATYVVITTCIIMLVLAVLNTKISKQIQRLATERKTTRQLLEKLTKKEKQDEGLSQALKEEAIVANATSINDLPKQYTVLDEVHFEDGKTAPHIVVSPYGLAVVGDDSLQEDIQNVLNQVNIQSPIFFYDPNMEVSTLVETIQLEKQIVLEEDQIYTILKQFIGL